MLTKYERKTGNLLVLRLAIASSSYYMNHMNLGFMRFGFIIWTSFLFQYIYMTNREYTHLSV